MFEGLSVVSSLHSGIFPSVFCGSSPTSRGAPPTVRLSAEAAPPVPSDVPRALQICIDRCLRFFPIGKSILTVL